MTDEETEINQNRERIGQILLEEHKIIDNQLEMALEFQKEVGGKLGNILVKLGFITEKELMQSLAKQQNMGFIDLENLVLPEELIKTMPEELIKKHQVLPVRLQEQENILTLAIHDQFDLEAIEDIQLATDYQIETILASREMILKIINHLFHSEEDQLQKFEQELEKRKQEEMESSFSMDSILIALIKKLDEKDLVKQSEILETLAEMKSDSDILE